MRQSRRFLARTALAVACSILMFAVALVIPLRAEAAPILRRGDRGDAVAALQRSLTELGYDPGPIDGDFGPLTDSALRRFQEAVGLYADGACGPLTRAALERATSDPSRAILGFTRALVGRTIAVDPGHGGAEPGALSRWGDREEDFTLDMGLKVKRYLEALGARVVMTRHGDYAPGSDWDRTVDELVARASLANTNRADLFVSIHTNSYPQDPGVSGTMGFYRAGSYDSLRLAAGVARQVSLATGLALIDVQRGPYYVLNNTYMPAALIEVGFMTNWPDVNSLRQERFRDAAARGIVAGIIDYFTR